LAGRQLIPKLKQQGRAARTAACVRDGGRTLELYLTEPRDLGPSLSELAHFLLEQGCEHALNLDGGPSTAAAYRDAGQLVRVGAGRELPYALRFSYGKR
jgi:exopolysaccharide biosynthesis protein